MTTLSESTVIKANQAHLTTTVDGELVILNDATGEYQALHGTGPHIWEAIQEPMSVESVLASIEEQFDPPDPDWREETIAFIDEMVEAQLVEIVNEAPA